MQTDQTGKVYAAPPSAALPKGVQVDLRVEGFTERVKTLSDGTQKTVIDVTYGLPGRSSYLSITSPVDDILFDLGDLDPGNLPQAVAHAKQNIIRSAYESWLAKSGRPVQGTPLAEWGAIGALEQQILRAAGFQTVEELGRASDSRMGRVQLPNAKGLRDLAQREMASGNGARLTMVEREQAETNRKQQDQIEELKAMVEKLLANATANATGTTGDEPKAKRPYTRRSVEEVEAAE